MKFDMKNIHTIFESAKSKNCVPSEHADKEGAKIDATLGSSDLNELFDNICPICGDVFASMKSAAADPKNLKITMTKTQDLGESAHIYIEAVEFATFCEAAELEINEAADAIKTTCEEMVPGSQDSELHVVFPSECLNKGNLGSNRFGLDVNNDWAMQLMRGCRRYGISVNSGVEDGEPVTESAYKKAVNEAAGVKSFKGHKIQIDGSSNQIAIAIKLCNSHWDKILDEAAKRMFEHSKKIDFRGAPEKLRTVESIRKALKLESVFYDNEGNKYNPICGCMNLSFDTKPSLDPHHSFTLYVDFDKNSNIKFNSAYDG